MFSKPDVPVFFLAFSDKVSSTSRCCSSDACLDAFLWLLRQRRLSERYRNVPINYMMIWEAISGTD